MADIALFERFVRTALSNVPSGRAPTEDELRNACSLVRPMTPGITDDEITAVMNKLQAALDVTMDVGIVLEKPYEPWLMARKTSVDFFYWNRYVLYLEEDMHRPAGIVATIDEVSDRIVDLAGDPTVPGPLRRGLLIGDVQSGKTANYLAVMNKAADVGYKVIILLTGTVESLRRQTQERVDEGFIGRSSKAYLQRNRQTIKKGVGSRDARRFATGLTTESSDFKIATMRAMNVSLSNLVNSEPAVFVQKKNSRTLNNLMDWLKTDPAMIDGRLPFPALIIDDEADNASVNTRTEDDPATINKLIRGILDLFTKRSYIAVTATPFANIFILPEKTDQMENEDLFPADYIYAMEPPSNYIGGNEIFGDEARFESALVRIDDADDFFPYKHKQDIYLDSLPESLYEALSYFVLANVYRDIKENPVSHRSMMINVSRYTKVQETIENVVREWLYSTQRAIRGYCMQPESVACQNPCISKLREMYYSDKYPFCNDIGLPWEMIQQQYLLSAVSQIEVRTINQRSATKLDYTEYAEKGLRVIAIGGLSLSRGLTLEGLMVSYFHRNTQMYDTLMQMGRWFGYRAGYDKLFRIWMPDDAIGWYAHITSASNELHEDIARMNRLGATPREFGLRVRAHPTSLIVTARNKMKHAEKVECWITLDGTFFETPRFKPDINVIRANRQRADEMLRNIVALLGAPTGSRNQQNFWRDVPAQIICDFLSNYENHPLNMEANAKTLVDYIKSNANFEYWDVLVPSGRESLSFALEQSITIGTIPRIVQMKSGVLSTYGTKMRIGTMGLTSHGLSDRDKQRAEKSFRDNLRETKFDKYVKKYGALAEEKIAKASVPDRAYLSVRKKPILILYYIDPSEDIPNGFIKGTDFMVGYGIGFPELAGSEPIYAVYYINTVEQKGYFDSEAEEDQIDDID